METTNPHHIATRFTQRFGLAVSLVTTLVLPTFNSLFAQTWDGGGTNNNWTTTTNWVGDLAPLNNGTANLAFGGVTRLTPNVDTPWAINSLSFNAGAGTFTIGGSTFTNGVGGITNNDADIQTINNTLTLGAAQTWTAAAGALRFGGNITNAGNALTLAGSFSNILNGIVSGSGGLTKIGTGVLRLAGSNTFAGGLSLREGTLLAAHDLALGTGALTWTNGTIQADGGARVLTNAVSLSGTPTIGGALDLTFTGATTVSGGTTAMTVSNTATTTFSGAISGPGQAFFKQGPGTLVLSGLSNNSFGQLLVSTGTVVFSKSPGVFAMSGSLSIGSGFGSPNSVLVLLGASNQIPDGSVILVGLSGRLDLAGFSEVVGPINLTGGSVDTGAGLLTANGPLNSFASSQSATIAGNVSLGGAVRTWTVNDGSPTEDLDVTAVISNGGLIKSGAGTLRFSGSVSDNYAGDTTVTAGTLVLNRSGMDGLSAVIPGNLIIGDDSGGINTDVVQHNAPNQIANTATVTVNSSGLLQVNSGGALSNLVMNGGNIVIAGGGADLALLGNVTGMSNASTATVSGAGVLNLVGGSRTFAISNGPPATDLDLGVRIQSGNLVKTGPGTLALSGANANAHGGNAVNEGTLVLNKSPGTNAVFAGLAIGDGTGGTNADVLRLAASDQISDSAALTITSSGLFDLADFSETVSALSITGGNVASGTGTFTFAALTTSAHSNTVTLSGNVALNGGPSAIFVDEGTAAVDVDIPAVILSGGLTKNGSGLLRFSGSTPNTYAGVTIVNGGTVVLAKPAGTNAMIGALTIGDGAGADTVRLDADHQLADTAAVHVNPLGLFDLNLKNA